MITMDLREAIQLQSVYGPGTAIEAYLAPQLGKARDSVLQFLTAPIHGTGDCSVCRESGFWGYHEHACE